MTIRQENTTKKKRLGVAERQIVAKIIAGALIIIVLLFAGGKISQWREPVRLEGNQACKEYATGAIKNIKANIDLQFGIATPEGTPSAGQVAEFGRQCDATINKYEIVVVK
jgi:hypothetical protein